MKPKSKVYRDRYYIIDNKFGTIDPSRGTLGYPTRRDAHYEIFSSTLDNPIIKKGSWLIENEICLPYDQNFDIA
jgi:hypothetical protein